MGIVNKLRELGFGYAFERGFERIVPVWMCRFSAVAVYQVDLNKFAGGPISTAAVNVCNNEQEFEHLTEVTGAGGDKNSTVGFVAKMDSKVVGGLWVALGNYPDHDLGLSFLLGQDGAWIYAAAVESAYRRQGIYSHLVAESARSRKDAGHAAPFIGVSKLNKGSHKAIQRFGKSAGEVLMIRLGSMVWARATGVLKQDKYATMQCTRRPIQLRVTEID